MKAKDLLRAMWEHPDAEIPIVYEQDGNRFVLWSPAEPGQKAGPGKTYGVTVGDLELSVRVFNLVANSVYDLPGVEDASHMDAGLVLDLTSKRHNFGKYSFLELVHSLLDAKVPADDIIASQLWATAKLDWKREAAEACSLPWSEEHDMVRRLGF